MKLRIQSQLKQCLALVLAPSAALLCGAAIAAANPDPDANGSTTDSWFSVPSRLDITGYLDVIGGSVLNKNFPANYSGPTQINGINCPCYVADSTNGGVYGTNFSMKAESNAGVQLQYNFTDDLAFVYQQLFSAGEINQSVQLFYFNIKLNDDFQLNIGRQIIPQYYYSRFENIGYTYPWVNVPQELYGGDANNYNGASLSFTRSIGGFNFLSSVFAGQEKIAQSRYYAFNASGDTDVHYTALVGADTEVSRGPLTVRAVYLQANHEVTNVTSPDADQKGPMNSYGLAVNLDLNSWFVLSEVGKSKFNVDANPNFNYSQSIATVGAGLRLGQWTPFINYAMITEHNSIPNLSAEYSPTNDRRASFTLRYDLDAKSDVKAEIDRISDTTSNNGGNANLLRVSYDRLF